MSATNDTQEWPVGPEGLDMDHMRAEEAAESAPSRGVTLSDELRQRFERWAEREDLALYDPRTEPNELWRESDWLAYEVLALLRGEEPR